MGTPWHFLVNQFIKSTEKSFAKALKLSNYHDAYLNRIQSEPPLEPDWSLLYNRYHTFHVQYVTVYTAWKNAGGQQQGQTLNLDQLLALLPSKLNKWNALIRSETGFEKGTASYLSIFPQGRTPFNSGGKTLRVEAVNVLKGNLIMFPVLSAVHLLVSDFYTQLDDARDTQEGAKGGTKQKSQELEQKRIEVMTEQYRNLGFLINKLAGSPQLIQPFFDLNVLRESRQTEFTSTLDPQENEAILIHTFAPDDELKFAITTDSSPSNHVEVPVLFYLATTANGTDSTAIGVDVNAAAITLAASDFGITDYNTHRYLTVVNPNAVACRYVVDLL